MVPSAPMAGSPLSVCAETHLLEAVPPEFVTAIKLGAAMYTVPSGARAGDTKIGEVVE
jgi:hypothetical protein